MTAPHQSDRPRRLVVYGRSSDLFSALRPDGTIWRRFPHLEVLHARTRLQLLRLAGAGPSFVIPIWGSEAARCPSGCCCHCAMTGRR